MANGREFGRRIRYEIRVKGNLDPEWSAWFDGLTITPQDGDETTLAGQVADQPALHGLLAKIRDLGLTLVSVNRKQIYLKSTREEQHEEKFSDPAS